MERKTISYAIFILNVVIFLVSCGNETTDIVNIDSSTNGVIVLKNTYKIPDTSRFIGTSNIISNDNKNFYFSNYFSRSIYHTRRPFTEIRKVGSSGKGPCEYSAPKCIKLLNKNIYFSDNNNPLIKSFPLNGKLIEDSCYSFMALHGGQKFALNNRFICILNDKTPIVSIYSRKNKELVKSLLKLNSGFYFPNSRFYGGGIVIDQNDYLYVVKGVPLKIWKINLNGNTPVLEGEWDYNNLCAIDTTQIKELFFNNEKNVKFKNLTKIPIVFEMFIFGQKKQNIIVDQIMHHGQYKHYYYIISNTGKLLYKMVSNKLTLIGAIDNNLFFVVQSTNTSDDFGTIKEYEYKVNIIND